MEVNEIKNEWNLRQKLEWQKIVTQRQVRDYRLDVVSRLRQLPSNTHVLDKYGSLSIDEERYPLFNVTVGDLSNDNPNILITGGVHGYKPSGIEASLRFLEQDAPYLTNGFNFVVYPCLSPWAYEFDHRWNAFAEDPNRHFSRATSVTQIDECMHFMSSIEIHDIKFDVAIDLHETHDMDVQLRQERARRFGTPLEPHWQSIPQGFYLMMTKPSAFNLRPRAQLGLSIIRHVREVSPIAPEKTLLGYNNHNGVVWGPESGNVLRVYLGHHADQVVVTEVYPDHKDVGPLKALDAQRAAIYGALDYVYS